MTIPVAAAACAVSLYAAERNSFGFGSTAPFRLALSQLAASEALEIVHRVDPAAPSLETHFRLAGAEGSAARRLPQWLAAALPEIAFDVIELSATEPHLRERLMPMALDLAFESRVHALRLHGDAPAWPLAAAAEPRPMDVAAALRVLFTAERPAELRLTLRRLAPGAARRTALDDLKGRLVGAKPGPGRTEAAIEGAIELARALGASYEWIRLQADLCGAELIDPLTRDLVCLTLFGTAADLTPADEKNDFRDLWPVSSAPEDLLPSSRRVSELLAAAPAPPPAPRSGDLLLDADGRLRLSAADRERHLYVLGATGSGKSTLLLQLFEQDARAGEGAILIDPHGDLADAAHRATPAHRRSEVILADAGVPGCFSLNVLKGMGGDPAHERNYVANALVRLFARVLYADIPEAFGPMFELYFRNALFLLMEANGESANLTDLDRIFLDGGYRRALLDRAQDPKVVEFWSETAPAVTSDELSLANIAPYIVCKLAQITGNPLLRPMLCAGEGLDIRAVMDAGGLLILKIPKGILGQTDAEILCALVTMRIVQAAMARAAQPPSARRPVRLYVDEFQTCVGEGLADLLAEGRKYGLSLVLANQSLSQVDGRRRRPDSGAAALANAANLVVFRVGATDAHRLAPWFSPEVSWLELCRLPDRQAWARLLRSGRPAPPRRLRT